MAVQKRRKGRRKGSRRVLRPKVCRFCEDAILYIDFKDNELLRRYVTEKGKIIPKRITGSCANHQKMLAGAIKRARAVAMMR